MCYFPRNTAIFGFDFKSTSKFLKNTYKDRDILETVALGRDFVKLHILMLYIFTTSIDSSRNAERSGVSLDPAAAAAAAASSPPEV